VYMPWLALHWVGGIPIIPMHIWKWIPQNVALNVDTWLYDIVYGTGPWILLDRTPGVSMTMIPFYQGQTYRGITLQRSYFYSPVRGTPSSDEEAYINGYMLPQYQMIKNVDPQRSYTIRYRFDIDFVWWNNTAGEWQRWKGQTGENYTAWTTITVNPGEVKKVWGTFPLPKTIPWCTTIMIHDSFHIEYVAPSPIYLIGRSCPTAGDYNNPYLGHTRRYYSDAYLSPPCGNDPEFFHVHPGDIAGKSPAPPPGGLYDPYYLAADGTCNINDVSIIGAHWQHNLPPGPGPYAHAGTYEYDVNDAAGWCRRADINGDNKVNIGDVAIIGVNWQKKWFSSSETLSANLTSGSTIKLSDWTRFVSTANGGTPFPGSQYVHTFYVKQGNPIVGLWTPVNTQLGNPVTYDHQFIATGNWFVIETATDSKGVVAYSLNWFQFKVVP